MSEKNDEYYLLNIFNAFSKVKFYKDIDRNNYIINKKDIFRPKEFDIFVFACLSIGSVFLNLMIGTLSFFTTLYFSNNEDFSNSISYLIMKGFSVLSIICVLYFSFVLSGSSQYHFLSFLVRKKNTSYFGQEEYDLVEKYFPEELEKWLLAIVDYGENKSNEAKKYADNIVKISQKRKDRAEKEKNRSVDEKWVDDRISSDALLEFE